MGLGPYTAPRAPDIAFVTAALGGLTALAEGGCVAKSSRRYADQIRSILAAPLTLAEVSSLGPPF